MEQTLPLFLSLVLLLSGRTQLPLKSLGEDVIIFKIWLVCQIKWLLLSNSLSWVQMNRKHILNNRKKMTLGNHILGLSKSKIIENVLCCLAELRTCMRFRERNVRNLVFLGRRLS